MTKRLILIRHAKSSWDDFDQDDHARVLNKRGEQSAPAIGTWMQKMGYLPDVILCSDAERTRQTARLIMGQLDAAPTLELRSSLYHAAPDTVIDLIKKQSTSTVAVIGHNPGIGTVASLLVDKRPKHHRFSDYPTCATCVLAFDVAEWAQIERGTCRDFIVPRDLLGSTARDID